MMMMEDDETREKKRREKREREGREKRGWIGRLEEPRESKDTERRAWLGLELSLKLAAAGRCPLLTVLSSLLSSLFSRLSSLSVLVDIPSLFYTVIMVEMSAVFGLP